MINMRYVAVAFLVIVIGSMAYVLYKNGDSIFKHEVVIDYPDGCQEKYVNGNLVTHECTRGRALLENGSTPIWNVNPEDLVMNEQLMNLSLN